MTDLMKKLLWPALVGMAVTLSAPTAGQAQFRSGFVGWTGMADTARDGLVNFAVYRPAAGDSDWTNDFGGAIDVDILAVPGSGTLDTNTFEVLFFQVVNTDPSGDSDTIDQLLISDPGGLITSTGYIDGRVFQDLDMPLSSPVGSDGNLVIGSESDPAPTPDDTVDGVPTRSDRFGALASPPFEMFIPAAAVVEPTSVDTGVPGFMRFNFSPAIPDSGPSTGFSSVVFVTSDSGPSVYREGRVGSGVLTPSNGDIPSPNPEPGPLVLVLVGVLGYAGYSVKKAKQPRADAELQTAPVAI